MRALPWPSRRQANLLLLVLVLSALVTGTWSFGTGSALAGPLTLVHGMLGTGVLVLAPRKQRTVVSGLRRARRTRWVSLLLLTAVTTTVATGFIHIGGLRTLWGYPTMHVHVIAAITSGVLVVWHAVARPARPLRTDRSRRAALRVGAVGVAAGLGALAVEGVIRGLGLPGADRRTTGSHEVASGDPQRMPATIWLDDRVPDIDPATWRLYVGGADGPRSLALPALAPLAIWSATLDCTSGWYSRQDWGGVAVADLLGPAPAEAGSVLVASATGYARRFPIADVGDLLVATTVGGQPLTARHGGPARLVAPGRRGFWWVKWLDQVRYDDRPWWAQPPFPLT